MPEKTRRSRQPPGDIRTMLPDALIEGEQPLSEDEKALVRRAYTLYDKFRGDLREAHEEMRKARMMRQLEQDNQSWTAPQSNTLNSCIDNVIADQIDNMPEARMYPERQETAQSAEEMTDVVSFVLYQAGWPGKYQQLMEDAVVTGTGVAQVVWNDEMLEGDGLPDITVWHPEDFFPDPQYENLQDGRGCFKATRTTVAWVEEHYPNARGYVKAETTREAEATYGSIQAPDGDRDTELLEFWYKRYDAKKKKTRVHMALMAGHALLYSTELDYGVERKGEFKEGVYAHGLYPFTMYKYRNVWRKPFGSGLIHDYRTQQEAIDRYQKYIDDNARHSSIQRYFIRKGSGIDASQVADLANVFIEWEGDDIRNVLQSTQASPINGQVYQMMQYLSDTMKQDCGQNQFSRGEGGLGVTAASAIEMLQNAGGKITRWHTEGFKDAFREMIEQLLWVLSEYMEPGRTLRIVGGWDTTGAMKERLVTLIATAREGDALPKPAYTVRVQVQRNNPGWIQEENNFVLQMAQICGQYGQPMSPEIVVSLLQGYPNKSAVLRAVQENSQIHVQMQQMQAQITQLDAQLKQQQQTNMQILKKMATPGGAQSTKGAGPQYSALEQSTDAPTGAPSVQA